ncbi:hypothetical protein YC2023_045682 [Brassica napus]
MICGAQASGKTPLFDDQFEFSRPYSSMIEVSHIHRNHRKGHDLDLMNRNFRTGDEHQEYSLDHSKPLLYFALCSGNHSDPAIRVYTPKWIYQELETAKEEYVHATFGVKKDQKLVLPKIIESFSKDSEHKCHRCWVTNPLAEEAVTWNHVFTVANKGLPYLHRYYDMGYPVHFLDKNNTLVVFCMERIGEKNEDSDDENDERIPQIRLYKICR